MVMVKMMSLNVNITFFLAPTGAQERLMLVHLFDCLVQTSL